MTCTELARVRLIVGSYLLSHRSCCTCVGHVRRVMFCTCVGHVRRVMLRIMLHLCRARATRHVTLIIMLHLCRARATRHVTLVMLR